MIHIQDFDVTAYLDWIHVKWWPAGSKNVGMGWVGIQCVYCHDDHNHLGIHLNRKTFSCWKCSANGSVLLLIQDLESIGYREAWQRINDFQNPLGTVQDDRQPLQDAGQGILPPDCLPALTIGQQAYLRQRRYSPDALVREWGLQAGPTYGSWRYRIIIPVYLRQRVVTFIGMDATRTREQKYIAAPIEESFMPTSEVLYGADHTYPNKPVVIVEGPTDVWRIGKGAVALLGMGMATRPQKLQHMLSLDASKYYIMLDGEDLAIKQAHTLGSILSKAGKEVEILELPSGDPDDLTDDEAFRLRCDLGLNN